MSRKGSSIKVIRHKTTRKPLYIEGTKGGGVRITAVPPIVREIVKNGKK